MALAILRFAGADGGHLQFDVELGRNRFFSYAVGDGEVDRNRGVPVLQNRSFTSPLVGPIAEHPVGRTTLEIPQEHFDRDNRYVQLVSYRTATLDGPAISDVVKVPVGGGGSRAPDDLPALVFGSGMDMTATLWRPTNGQRAQVPVPFAYREAPQVSSAMFLGALLPVLSNVLPVVGKMLPTVGKMLPMVGNLLGGLAGAGKGSAGGGTVTAPPVLQTLTSPDTIKLIQELIQQITAAASGVAAKQAALPTAASMARTPATRQAIAQAQEYSHAAIAPAVLAALPALAPLLEKVLTPDTIKAVLGHLDPTKVIGAVTDSVTQIGKLGLEANEQENKHLRALNPGVDDPGLDRLLSELSLARSTPGTVARDTAGDPRYRRVESVTLDFTGTTPLLVHGRTRICYRSDGEIAFPLSVKTPRPITGARLVVLVKDPATREILIRQRVAVPEAPGGALPVVPRLSRTQVEHLRPNEDYLVCAYLLWKNASKKTIGTSRSQLVTLMGEYAFDRVEEDGALLPLDDVVKFRDYWHKVWQGTFSADRRRVAYDCKYYYALEAGRGVSRMETVTKTGREFHKDVGRLKSGLVASPAALNRLIPMISAHPALDDGELSALGAPDFVARYNQAARFKAELHGRPGSSAALWVYPEVKMQRVVLSRATRTNPDGHVEEVAEHAVHFPMPALIHYIGARTEQ